MKHHATWSLRYTRKTGVGGVRPHIWSCEVQIGIFGLAEAIVTAQGLLRIMRSLLTLAGVILETNTKSFRFLRFCGVTRPPIGCRRRGEGARLALGIWLDLRLL